MPSLNELPVDILLAIFRYLDIADILCTRQVSRYLNDVSHHRSTWNDAYRNADFVRPPGPFPSQSAHDLEHTLVPSFRLDRNLRRGGDENVQSEKRVQKLREIRYTGVALHVSLVFGRFLLIAFSAEVRCYDLSLDAFDSNSGASIIYRPASGGTLQSFDCISSIDVEGRPFACVVLREAARPEERAQMSIYLVKVTEQSEVTLDLLYQSKHRVFDIHFIDLGPRVIIVQGRVGPIPYKDWRVVAMDVHTRMRFRLPGLTHPSQEMLQQVSIVTFAGISTSTHLILAMSLYTLADGSSLVLRAFTLPPPGTHAHPTTLSQSHRGIVLAVHLHHHALLHDAILDSTTQDTLITVRVEAFGSPRTYTTLSNYGFLRLARPRPDAVGTITFELLGPLGQLSLFPITRPSFNGTGRVFHASEPDSRGIITALEYNIRHENGNDEKPRDKMICYPSILRFPTPRKVMDYDPYSGRICLQSSMTKYSVIEVLDLAV